VESRARAKKFKYPELDDLFQKHGYADYKWMDPQKIVVAQWVRMKCMFGCGEYGKNATCPPNTPSVAECERFFREYQAAAIFHFQKKVKKPEARHVWTKKENLKLFQVEREVFISGYERAFLLYMDSCYLCTDCTGDRKTCQKPRLARPSPESMAVDVYRTVRPLGFPIQVLADYQQAMDRYAILLVE